MRRFFGRREDVQKALRAAQGDALERWGRTWRLSMRVNRRSSPVTSGNLSA